MQFRIADSFTDSLARLAGAEQKAAKLTAMDLQLDPARPGLRFHKLGRARDTDFRSVRVNRDIRLIVHRTGDSLMLCFVGHHDRAYAWAERRRLETHPKTGAAQFVEVREVIEAAPPPRPTETPPPAAPAPAAPAPAPLSDIDPDDLLSHGVPEAWLNAVRAADEATLLDIAMRLPAEAGEAVLKLAVGETPEPAVAVAPETAPLDHPDAQRRFRVVEDLAALEQALDYPWERWCVFLHPAQARFATRDYAGPARVAGSAGTGKTVVALHRAVHLARRNPDAKVLLTTFSKTLANALATKLDRLIGNVAAVHERIAVREIAGIAHDLYAQAFGEPSLAPDTLLRTLLTRNAEDAGLDRHSPSFLLAEWRDVVDAWQLRSWEAYRDIARLGRRSRLGERQRGELWQVFTALRAALAERGLVTESEVHARVAAHIAGGGAPPFAFAVIDEAQDLSVGALRMLAALGGGRPNALFFAGDLGQRIFQTPFSWRALGVDIRGRSQTLRVNYRTSHQIRGRADRLLPAALSDIDGNEEGRRGTVSVFNGPVPEIETFASPGLEADGVAGWLGDCVQGGFAPHEIGVFVRAADQIGRALKAVQAAGLAAVRLDETVATRADAVSVGTMHLAKGLEFRAVAVMACDDEVIPRQERIETIADEADLDEVYATERHLLYVACTRARERLLVSGVEPESEFLDDLAL